MTKKLIERTARSTARETLDGWMREMGDAGVEWQFTYTERRTLLLMLETTFYAGYQQALRDELARIEHEQKQDRTRSRLFGEKRR